MESSTCLELALEGERLCKAGDFHSGVEYLSAAINVGTDDTRVLSAVYSQLGNASFYLGDYNKALQYHLLDLNTAKAAGDLLGEAKASGNLGNTLKMMGKFDEAVTNCERHLSISREKGDKIGEARALYNLGNVYHAKGKHIARASRQEPGELPSDVQDCLRRAIHCYEENLKLMVALGDRSAQGRAYGNLGNTYYLLGNFKKAIAYHEQRLKLAKEFGDKAAQRRANSNLGNAHIFLGEFGVAAEHYTKTYQLAKELGDRAVEAQACYSLGNTYTLLRDFERAIEFHLKHLQIAEELRDRVGEGRAYWSLCNAHCSLGDHKEALHYATRHLHVSQELGDKVGQATAQMSIADLKQVLEGDASEAKKGAMDDMSAPQAASNAKHTKPAKQEVPSDAQKQQRSGSDMDQDAFFELLSEFQSKRMDDQRCSITPLENKENVLPNGSPPYPSPTSSGPEDSASVREELLDLIVGMQSRRMDEQRTSLPQLPGLRRNNHNNNSLHHHHRMSVGSVLEDDFFDMIVRCQGSRLEDQRSSMPTLQRAPSAPVVPSSRSAPTVPDEDFFSLILRVQAGRIEDQRTSFRPPDAAPTTSSAPVRASLKGSLKSALRGSRHSKSKQ
ncbi:G-protein-signaling modulator 2 isoform X1 [Dermacentor silvarum]|uniref:G-protein-signaling modulator 2 isoform X1 n=2 Tax=Dermacentor silvarum TaxID=543639 RepID=UPI00189A6403|nr:G-protein-signaling modulator 2 isoform X1 [Dermacentor silvarum]